MTTKTRPALALLCTAMLSAFGTAALAQTTSASPSTYTEATRLASRYSTFAGSDANSMALVDGLRNGTAITLETTSTVTTPTTFQPATGKLGYGNVNIALALAEADLNKLGITDPTSAQIAAALNGGNVTLNDGSTENLQGVLALRAKGEGWGQISNTLGTGKLGAIVSAAENSHSQAGIAQANRPNHHGHPMDMTRPPHPVHPDHPTLPQHPSIPNRPDIPSHVGRPGGG